MALFVAVERHVRTFSGLLVVAGFFGWLPAGTAWAQSPATPASEPSAPSAASAAKPAAAYVIGPSDVLLIVVWKEPELSRPVTVRVDGMATFPLLGDVQAAGHTPTQLAEIITEGLRRFIEVPRVTVGIEQANSSRVYVLGQVNKSGEFPLGGPTTVLQALALAGGFKEFAKTDTIAVVRKDGTVLPVNYKRIADGKDTAQNVLLLPGDTVVVP
jgi:polysaccharide export outer membrane protein